MFLVCLKLALCPHAHNGYPADMLGSIRSSRSLPNVSLFIPYEPNSNFGLPRTMFNPRQLQFAVKFSF